METILTRFNCTTLQGKLKLLIKCIIFVIGSTLISTSIHAFDSAFIQHVHGKPSFVSSSLMYFSLLERALFVIGYLVLGYQLPIKNHVLRGFTYFMLICMSNYLPQVMGLAGADGEIAHQAFSASIIIDDCIGYILSGFLLGFLFNEVPDSPKRFCLKPTYSLTIAISGICFPLIVIALDQIVNIIYPPFASAGAIGVSSEAQSSFFVIFYSCFIVSGIFLAIFYRMTEYNQSSPYAWLLFGLKYDLLIWTPVVMIMVIFGTPLVPTVFYSFLFLICILLISWLNSRLLDAKMA